MLSDTFIPSLDDHEKDENGNRRKERKRYGKGRFKFPSHDREDDDEDDSTGDVSSDDDDDDDEDTHGVVSLFAKEIMRQKMMETQRRQEVDMAGALEVAALSAAMSRAEDDGNVDGNGDDGGSDVADETKAMYPAQPAIIAHPPIPSIAHTTGAKTATTIVAPTLPTPSGEELYDHEDQEDPQVTHPPRVYPILCTLSLALVPSRTQQRGPPSDVTS